MARLDSVQPIAEQPAHLDQGSLAAGQGVEEFGPWLTSRQACRYIPCPTLNAFYQWCHRHGVVRASDGTISRATIDRIKTRKRKRRVMAAASLANLRWTGK